MNTSIEENSNHINTVYPLEEDHVSLEEDRIGGYIDNIIVVFLQKGVDESVVLDWFPGENPTIVGRFPGIRQVQVRIKSRTKQELEDLANKLMEKEQVLYAHLELAASLHQQIKGSPSFPKNHSQQEDPSFMPNQKKPEKEWWYSTIGLEEAHQHLPPKELVKVGVVDDGFDTHHPDLNLKFPSQEQERLNFPEEHGTHVAGILQQILPESTITVSDSFPRASENPLAHISSLSQTMKYLLDMVESGVKVINYSMGADITEDKNLPWNREIASIFSVYLWQLKQTGYDYLVVQSAGNAGIDASRNGFFSSISPENCLGSREARISLGVDKNLVYEQKKVFDGIVIVAVDLCQ